MESKKTVFECICQDTNHMLVVTRWEDSDDEWDEFYIEVQAHPFLGFWGRLWLAIKYVWNPTDGCFWSGTSLSREEAKRFRQALLEYVDRVPIL